MADDPHPPPAPPSRGIDPASSAGEPSATVADDRPCIKCSYNLRGLPGTGNCPECGTPVERSLQGDLIRYASPEYAARLHTGAFLVQAGIISSILITAASLAIGIAGGVPGGGLFSRFAALVPAALWLSGWWLLSTPDPGQLSSNKGERPRRLIRIATFAHAVITVLNLVVSSLGVMGVAPTVSGASTQVLAIGVGVVSLGATLLQFFASMLYIAWLGPRLPSLRVVKRARMMLWLGPVLFTIGLLMLGLGPLIALVLYFNLFDWVRNDLKLIRAGRRAVTGLN